MKVATGNEKKKKKEEHFRAISTLDDPGGPRR
jgi:hypothetical protein